MRRGGRGGAGALIAGAALLLIMTASAGAAVKAKHASAAKNSNAHVGSRGVSPDGSKVLVRVGGEAITGAMVQARIEQLPEAARGTYGTAEGRQRLLERMVEEKVWLMAALKNGVAERPKVKEQLEQQRRELVIRTYLNELMAANPQPADSEAKVYYQAHLSEYKVQPTVTVRHIQCASEADAKRMKGWAKSGDFAKLAQKYSTDSLSRALGGVIGTVTRDGMFSSIGAQPALAESAFALGEGKVGGPHKTSKGWSVIKVDAVHPESVNPFEQMRPMILRQLSSQRAQEYYKGLLEKARTELGVKADSDAIRGFQSQKRGAREMFKQAQEETGAAERIAAYRRLLAAWPDSEVSPQAQFMIGFINSEELKNYDEADKAFHELLNRYPKSELAASARWMVEHMRSEEAPAFVTDQADSLKAPPAKEAPAVRTKHPSGAHAGPQGKP